MKIVFFGSSEFAVPSLRALLGSGHEVLCVVTQPDKKQGRGMCLSSTPVKQAAQALKLKVYQPILVNSPEAIKTFRDLNPDLFVVIAYGQFLSAELLKLPKFFPVNLHASLLPKYRGAAPVNWAIINGERRTGNSVIKLSGKMDAGEILTQEETRISDNETAVCLEARLSHMGVALLLNSIDSVAAGKYNLTAQDESKATFARRLKRTDGLIDWGRPAQDIHNLIRGCLEWPGAFTYYKHKMLKIFQSEAIKSSKKFSPGELANVAGEGLSVGTGKGVLLIKELQPEGKRRMPVSEFIAGHKLSVGERFGRN